MAACGSRAIDLRRRTSPSITREGPSSFSAPVGLELRPAEFVDICEIGSGFGGVVYRSVHLPSGRIVARKTICSRIASAQIRKSLAAELSTLQRCHSPNIVECYGASVCEMQISLAMEYMDVGSLEWVCRTIGPLPEAYLAVICAAVLHGLAYLHREHNIIHRDLKPSNILLNSHGEVKLCDFGESIELVNSLARSLVGTTGYMAPERVKGSLYSIRSDIWSLGITLVELATGRFPFQVPLPERQAISPATSPSGMSSGEEAPLAIIELWESIANEPVPALHPHYFSANFYDFVRCCLIRDERERPDCYDLLRHPFLRQRSDEGFQAWCQSLLQLRRNLDTSQNTA